MHPVDWFLGRRVGSRNGCSGDSLVIGLRSKVIELLIAKDFEIVPALSMPKRGIFFFFLGYRIRVVSINDNLRITLIEKMKRVLPI